MLDDLKDRKPFDVSSLLAEDLAGEIPSLKPGRITTVPRSSLRRLADDNHRPALEPGLANPPTMEEPTGPEDATEALLAERQTTHGSFEDNAKVSQRLKALFREHLGWDMLTDVEREAMDMIALKFSRILSGKSMERQHWEDVAGYARLVEALCK